MSGPDFTSMLDAQPIDEIEKPKPLPEGSYQARIVKIENGETREKKTKYVRFNFEVVQPLEDVDEDALETFGDVAGKKVRTDFYVTENSLFMLKDFVLYHVGIEPEDGVDRLSPLVSECQNQEVGIKIKHEISNDGQNTYAVVDGTFNLED